MNVGFAALSMNKVLGFSSAMFGFGSGIFFDGYFLFEIASNLILAKVGARRWIARILVTRDIISALVRLSYRFLVRISISGCYI